MFEYIYIIVKKFNLFFKLLLNRYTYYTNTLIFKIKITFTFINTYILVGINTYLLYNIPKWVY